MKDKIQFDSKYNFDLPINHYMFVFRAEKREREREPESPFWIYYYSVVMYVCIASYIITFDITKYSTIKCAGNIFWLLLLLFERLFSTSFIHPCYFSHSHPRAHTRTHTQLLFFSLFVFETLTAPNNIVNRTKSEDNNIIDTKCMGLRLNSCFFVGGWEGWCVCMLPWNVFVATQWNFLFGYGWGWARERGRGSGGRTYLFFCTRVKRAHRYALLVSPIYI